MASNVVCIFELVGLAPRRVGGFVTKARRPTAVQLVLEYYDSDYKKGARQNSAGTDTSLSETLLSPDHSILNSHSNCRSPIQAHSLLFESANPTNNHVPRPGSFLQGPPRRRSDGGQTAHPIVVNGGDQHPPFDFGQHGIG